MAPFLRSPPPFRKKGGRKGGRGTKKGQQLKVNRNTREMLLLGIAIGTFPFTLTFLRPLFSTLEHTIF